MDETPLAAAAAATQEPEWQVREVEDGSSSEATPELEKEEPING